MGRTSEKTTVMDRVAVEAMSRYGKTGWFGMLDWSCQSTRIHCPDMLGSPT